MKHVYYVGFAIFFSTMVQSKPLAGQRGLCQLYDSVKDHLGAGHTLVDAVDEIKDSMIDVFASDFHCYEIEVHLPDLKVCHQRVPGMRYNFKWRIVKLINHCVHKSEERTITNVICKASWLIEPRNPDFHPHFGIFKCVNDTSDRQLAPKISLPTDTSDPNNPFLNEVGTTQEVNAQTHSKAIEQDQKTILREETVPPIQETTTEAEEKPHITNPEVNQTTHETGGFEEESIEIDESITATEGDIFKHEVTYTDIAPSENLTKPQINTTSPHNNVSTMSEEINFNKEIHIYDAITPTNNKTDPISVLTANMNGNDTVPVIYVPAVQRNLTFNTDVSTLETSTQSEETNIENQALGKQIKTIENDNVSKTTDVAAITDETQQTTDREQHTNDSQQVDTSISKVVDTYVTDNSKATIKAEETGIYTEANFDTTSETDTSANETEVYAYGTDSQPVNISTSEDIFVDNNATKTLRDTSNEAYQSVVNEENSLLPNTIYNDVTHVGTNTTVTAVDDAIQPTVSKNVETGVVLNEDNNSTENATTIRNTNTDGSETDLVQTTTPDVILQTGDTTHIDTSNNETVYENENSGNNNDFIKHSIPNLPSDDEVPSKTDENNTSRFNESLLELFNRSGPKSQDLDQTPFPNDKYNVLRQNPPQTKKGRSKKNGTRSVAETSTRKNISLTFKDDLETQIREFRRRINQLGDKYAPLHNVSHKFLVGPYREQSAVMKGEKATGTTGRKDESSKYDDDLDEKIRGFLNSVKELNSSQDPGEVYKVYPSRKVTKGKKRASIKSPVEKQKETYVDGKTLVK